MGTWDTSLYGGDLPLDIKDEYYEQLYEGHTPEEAAALVWKELQLGEEDLRRTMKCPMCPFSASFGKPFWPPAQNNA